MRVVIDTNVLLNSVPKNGKNRWLYLAFIAEEFEWVFSNDIVTEYAEVIAREFSPQAAEIVFSILLSAPNTIRKEPYFNWQMVEDDPYDNKFVDCALSANVDYLVTNDKHILKLRRFADLFPPIPIVTPEEFREILERQ